MTDLSEKKCIPCEGGIPGFDITEIHKYLKMVNGWKVEADKSKIYYLIKEFKFKNFLESQNFVNKVGKIAEIEEHHPDIWFGWGYAKIKIFTNAIKGLQDNIAIWGKQIPIWDGKKISRRYMWSNFGDEPQTNYWCESEDRYFFHNAFSIFRTSYLKKYPFDEHYSGKEDRYWANKQIENGFEILYDSEQEVKHHYTPGGATWMGTG